MWRTHLVYRIDLLISAMPTVLFHASHSYHKKQTSVRIYSIKTCLSKFSCSLFSLNTSINLLFMPPRFVLSWQLHPLHPSPNIPITHQLSSVHVQRLQTTSVCRVLSQPSHLRCPSDVLVPDLVTPGGNCNKHIQLCHLHQRCGLNG